MHKWNDEKVQAKIKRLIDDRLILVGEYVSGSVKLLTPVVTGNLRDSVTYATEKKISKVGSRAKQKDATTKPDDEMTVRIGTQVVYAAKVEKKRQMFYYGLKASKQPILKIMQL